MKHIIYSLFALAMVATVGCSSYRWTSSVPEEMRTVYVPTFRNESDLTELGNIVTRQVLREFQREGTFSIASRDNAAIEVQGVLKSRSTSVTAYNVRSERHREMTMTAKAVVSVIDKTSGKILFENRSYTARTTFLSAHDTMTSERDASGRLAEDFAQQIVDDVLSIQFKE